jgi:hypothetical protein
VREKLDIWPPLPIKILSESPNLGDNIIAALEHPDRIRDIWLWNIHPPLDRLVTMMQESFPQLESLHIAVVVQTDETVPALPITFLGGSAPRLRTLQLDRIPFPTLPRLLMSCNDLVHLSLPRIPHSGYISPETMATSISTLTKLRYLFIGFDSPASLPYQRAQRPPLLPRASAVLPAVTHFSFCGISEYLEDLVARINAPLLHTVRITFFNQPIFGTQQLTQFIGHAPMFMSYNQAEIDFRFAVVSINCSSIEQDSGYLKLDIICIGEGVQVSSMAQICSQFPFLMSRIEWLHIQAPLDSRLFTVNMEDIHWPELFRPFTAVQALYLPRQFLTLIMPTLHGLSEESATDLLPALIDLYLEGYQVPASGSELQDIELFITARQHSGRPVVVRRWDRS